MSTPSLWSQALLTTIIVLTVTLIAACIAASFTRRSASRRNIVLLPGLVMSCLAPVAVLAAPIVGGVIEAPIPAGPLLDWSGSVARSSLPTTLAGSDPAPAAAPFVSPPAVDRSASSAGLETPALTSGPITVRAAWFGFVGFWASGAAVALAGLVVSWLRLRRLVAAARPVDVRPHRDTIERARRCVGLAAYPSIAISDRIATPVAVGTLGRGRVLLPAGFLRRVGSEQLVHVLIHEGAHIAHRDPMLRIVQGVSRSLWWWHPLVHRLNTRLSQTREDLCDNVVLSHTDPVEYSATLLTCGRLVSAPARPTLAAALFRTHETLEHRIRKLLTPGRNTMNRSRPLTRLGVCLAAAATIMLSGAARVTAGSLDAPIDAIASPASHDETATTREFVLSFTDSSQPRHLDVDIKRGDIIVTGHDGDDVFVRLTTPAAATPSAPDADGLRTIRATPIDFNVRQSGGTIELNGDSWDQVTDLEILVPYRTNLTLDTYRDGVVKVADVEGVIKARSYFNDIALHNVAGEAEVEGYHGAQTATFRAVTGPLSFETYHGVVDLTIPAEITATTRVRTTRGVMRTDFDIDPQLDLIKTSEHPDGGRSIQFDSFIVGDINGGGPLCTIETNTGDILLRRGMTFITD